MWYDGKPHCTFRMGIWSAETWPGCKFCSDKLSELIQHWYESACMHRCAYTIYGELKWN